MVFECWISVSSRWFDWELNCWNWLPDRHHLDSFDAVSVFRSLSMPKRCSGFDDWVLYLQHLDLHHLFSFEVYFLSIHVLEWYTHVSLWLYQLYMYFHRISDSAKSSLLSIGHKMNYRCDHLLLFLDHFVPTAWPCLRWPSQVCLVYYRTYISGCSLPSSSQEHLPLSYHKSIVKHYLEVELMPLEFCCVSHCSANQRSY